MDLRRMRFLINRLPMARFRVERAMSKATRCTANLSGMPRGGSGSNPVEAGALMLADARGAYDAICAELSVMRAELQPLIPSLPDPLERTAMQMRYIDGVSAREIAWRLNYSEQHIHRVLRSAEHKVDKDVSHVSP